MLLVQGVEKTIISKMLEKGSNKRTFPVDRHAGVVRGPFKRITFVSCSSEDVALSVRASTVGCGWSDC